MKKERNAMAGLWFRSQEKGLGGRGSEGRHQEVVVERGGPGG